MPTASKISRTVLVAAAIGILLAERYHRRKLTLHAAEMHQTWLSEVAANEKLRAAWAPPGKQLSSDDYALSVHSNRQLSLLSAKFRTGLLDRHTLRVQARRLMRREISRTYWRAFGTFPEQEAKDRVDRVFNHTLADEYVPFSDPDAVAA